MNYLPIVLFFVTCLYNNNVSLDASSESQSDSPYIDSSLVKKILVMYEKDQYYRKLNDSFYMANRWLQDSLDKENQLELNVLIDSFGYPGLSLVGVTLKNKAFLVIQHANLAYQEHYLPVLIDAAKRNELNWGSVALLIDRIEVSHGRRQIYGSQVGIDSFGNKFVYPILDETDVNLRRQSVGLDSLEKYLLRFNIIYKSRDTSIY